VKNHTRTIQSELASEPELSGRVGSVLWEQIDGESEGTKKRRPIEYTHGAFFSVVDFFHCFTIVERVGPS
jgi:hypothetical protein